MIVRWLYVKYAKFVVNDSVEVSFCARFFFLQEYINL